MGACMWCVHVDDVGVFVCGMGGWREGGGESIRGCISLKENCNSV